MNKRICIITEGYPEKGRPIYTFVKNIVDALADNGNHCIVISPYHVNRYKKFISSYYKYTTSNGNIVEVYRPNIFTISNLNIMGFQPSRYIFKKAINKVLKKLKVKPDVIYGHFWRNAICAYEYAYNNNIPLFVATGESIIELNDLSGKVDDFAKYVSGVISVSTKNKYESIEKGLTIPEKCRVIPNAINPSVFKKMDKQECRRKLGIDADKYISITVGAFTHRKGILRVSSAIDEISDNVYSIFIGHGLDVPNCKNILFSGRIDNKDLPLYLNAADIFVLPTLHEGCCNAIIEAMACGLPIISSNLSFNWDILNETNSILIDPNDVDEIAQSIKLLKDNIHLRNRLSEGALRTASELTLHKRAIKIEEFINYTIS